jgi:hypothetical protein
MTIRDISKLADELIASVASNKPSEKVAKDVTIEKPEVKSELTKKASYQKVKIERAEGLKKLASDLRNATFSNDITYQDVNNYVKLLTK